MRVLLANLKLLYQARRLWVVYLFWGFLMWPCLGMARYGGGAFVVLITMALPGAWIVATMLEEVSKPFSFCLPNQRENVRGLVFLVGLTVSIMGGLYFVVQHGFRETPIDESLLVLCLGWCFTAATYWAGVALTLALGSGVMMSVVILIYIGLSNLGMSRSDFDRAVLSHPFLLISLTLFLMATVWRWLGHPGTFRKYCTRPASAVLFGSVRSSEQEERRIAASIRLSQPPLTLGTYILSRIRAGGPSGPANYLWGTVYTTVLPFLLVLTSKRGMAVSWVLLLLAIVLAAGYVPNLAVPFVFMLLLVGASGLDDHSPVFSEMLLGGGRRERFYTTLILIGILAGLSALILMAPILVLNLLAPVLPEVEVGGSVRTFHRISLWLPMLSIIVFPVLGLMSFCFHARQAGGVISWTIGFAALPLLIFHPISGIPLRTLVLVAAVAWVLLVFAIRRIAMRSDLVRR